MIAGIFGVVFGILGILTFGIIFVPLAAVCAVIGLIRSIITRNMGALFVAVLAGVLTVIGFVVSPSLWLATVGVMSAVQQTNAPITPDSFAWRVGQPLPPGVTLDNDGIPHGYEMRSGMSHGCTLPDCMWLVRSPDATN